MIDSTAIIRGDVDIHETAIVEPYAVITGPVVIGPRAYIGAHAVIGAPAQHSETAPAPRAAARKGRGVVIGADSCLREFCSVHQGVLQKTRVGSRCLLMAGCHVGHDSMIGQGVTMAPHSLLAGFTYVGDDVTFGQGVVTHPWVVVGQGAMVGLNSTVLRDVDPYAKVAGSPVRLLGRNTHKAPMPEDAMTTVVLDRHEVLLQARDYRKKEWYAYA